MKLGRGINVEHIKRMTLRTVRESTEGHAEVSAFLDALERNDYDESLSKRETKQLERVMTAKVRTNSPSTHMSAVLVLAGSIPRLGTTRSSTRAHVMCTRFA
jgi:hypothetical protein